MQNDIPTLYFKREIKVLILEQNNVARIRLCLHKLTHRLTFRSGNVISMRGTCFIRVKIRIRYV